jgi:AbrB family looped-hinge helix DNA binding protein
MEENDMDAIHTTIGKGGRLVIPAVYRQKFGISEGDEVTVTCDETGVHISTPEIALKKLQHIAKTRILKGNKKRSVVGEFISERRKEARSE